jgi:hypothetical protein
MMREAQLFQFDGEIPNCRADAPGGVPTEGYLFLILFR